MDIAAPTVATAKSVETTTTMTEATTLATTSADTTVDNCDGDDSNWTSTVRIAG